MAVFKRRTRLVSFRLSDEEYERVQGACMAEGARSISEFARAALQRPAETERTPVSNGENTMDAGTRELVETMKELTRELGRLASVIRTEDR